LLKKRVPTSQDAYLEKKTIQEEQEISEKEPGQPEGMAQEIPALSISKGLSRGSSRVCNA
jgi:hypothetical protein